MLMLIMILPWIPYFLLLEDGWVKASGTTLGADDGIGIAAAMAILASDEYSVTDLWNACLPPTKRAE